MESRHAPRLHPALLPLGTVVGLWRVVDWAGNGVHGAVYRAVPADAESAGSVALKLSLVPGAPRFAREVRLLSMLDHPSVPHLLDSGEWRHPNGMLHPYLVMEWVEGVPLYDWAREQPPSSEQVLRVLSQLARALEAVHELGAVHRDVKGSNVRVRLSDGRAFLMDFGSGIHPGASTLTPPSEQPGTPAYRSPESALFPLRTLRDASARYVPSPADDLYSLGVTAYRWVTGQYPELGEPFRDEAGVWQPGELASPPVGELVPGVEPRLEELIERMLSLRPEERGPTKELAEALEKAALEPGESATAPKQRPQPEEPEHAKHFAQISEAQARGRLRRAWCGLAACGLTLLAWSWWSSAGRQVEERTVARVETRGDESKGQSQVGLAEAVASSAPEEAPDGGVPELLAEDSLPEPLPGQVRPDAHGRCPGKGQLALNGGCWIRLGLQREECEGSGYVFTSQCYGPVLAHPRKRQPTSAPGQQP